MANIQRGEIAAVIGGEERTLCLTLGALAELEARLVAGDLVGLGERFAGGRVSARDLTAILGAGLRGGGNAITDDDLARMAIEGGLRGRGRDRGAAAARDVRGRGMSAVPLARRDAARLRRAAAVEPRSSGA